MKGKGVEQKKTTIMLSTDMMAELATVNHRKKKYCGFDQSTLELMTSFLTNKTQYIELEGKNSDAIPNQSCSVIKGSKLSGFLFLLYINPCRHNTTHDGKPKTV